jgi:hypothetical protein
MNLRSGPLTEYGSVEMDDSAYLDDTEYPQVAARLI